MGGFGATHVHAIGAANARASSSTTEGWCLDLQHQAIALTERANCWLAVTESGPATVRHPYS